MLKFLEQVNGVILFTAISIKIVKEGRFAKKLEKRPHAEFWPKMSISEKTQYPIFMQFSKLS